MAPHQPWPLLLITCSLYLTPLFYLLGEPAFLARSLNTHLLLSLVCYQLFTLCCFTHPDTPRRSSYSIYIDDINNISRPVWYNMYYWMELTVLYLSPTLWPSIHRLYLCSHHLDPAIHCLYSGIYTVPYWRIQIDRSMKIFINYTVHPQPSFYLYLILQIFQRFWAEFFSSFSCTLTKVGTHFFYSGISNSTTFGHFSCQWMAEFFPYYLELDYLIFIDFLCPAGLHTTLTRNMQIF